MFNSSEEKTIQNTHDGVLSFHQPDIHICCERVVLFLRSMFKFRGHTQLPEVCATSSCLLAVACFVVLNIPVFVYIGLNITSTAKEWTLDNALLAALWASTTTSMNSTFNCSIFYWKNKILRTEGMKVIKSMKIC
jgi:hypothetical protein